ncbi:phage/plasmid primase, P4 family [Lactiplantibacillus plantarum]|nr:phage/plasmid primase, P4 family [Lactiplantibacillus plantarum]
MKTTLSLGNQNLAYLKSYINPRLELQGSKQIGDQLKIARFATSNINTKEYWQQFGFLSGAIQKCWLDYQETEHAAVKDASDMNLFQTITRFGILLLRKNTDAVFDEGRDKVNREGLSRFLNCALDLKQTANDNILLIYNWVKCVYEESQQNQVLGKIVTVITNTIVPDSWSQGLDTHLVALLSRALKPTDGDKFDVNYAAFGSRLIDLTTLQSGGEADPQKLTRMHSDVQFNPDATCPLFNQFLDDVLPDPKDQAFLQQYTGYLLEPSFKANAFLVIKGDGRNGKSVYLNLIKKLLGKLNVSSSKIESLAGDFGLAPLVNKRANLSSEGQAASFDTAEIKAICSGDAVTINAKNQAQYTTVLKAKFIFMTNNMPVTTDTSDGFSRRLNILPFRVQIPLDKVDVDLESKLTAELSGILNWALNGLRELRKNNFNFTNSDSMREAKERYMLYSRPVERFIKARLAEAPSSTLTIKYLREQYGNWLKQEGISDMGTANSRVFPKKLSESFQSLWGQPAPIVNTHGHVKGLSGYRIREDV